MNLSGYEPKGFRVSPTSRIKIRESTQMVADVVRRHLNKGEHHFPIVECIEMLSACEELWMEIVEDWQLGDVAALVKPGTPPLLQVSESVYDGACRGGKYERFTLAHELGHYFLHSRQRIALTRDTGSGPRKHKAFEDSEWQANTFAGELLIDCRIVVAEQLTDPTAWPDIFQVSSEAADIQWREFRKAGII